MNPFTPLTLPNGSQLMNRLAKAAMEENMADRDHAPSAQLSRLYRTWAQGGAGLFITGNVMVDGRAMTGPGGVVLDSPALSPPLSERFMAWAEAAKSGGRPGLDADQSPRPPDAGGAGATHPGPFRGAHGARQLLPPVLPRPRP